MHCPVPTAGGQHLWASGHCSMSRVLGTPCEPTLLCIHLGPELHVSRGVTAPSWGPGTREQAHGEDWTWPVATQPSSHPCSAARCPHGVIHPVMASARRLSRQL